MSPSDVAPRRLPTRPARQHASRLPTARVAPFAFLGLGLLLAAPAPGFGQGGPSIYISADMEGVTGVVTGEQLGPGGFEYARFREFMTEEVNTVIEAARAAGAGRILVSDSHGNGQNLLIERLPDDVEVVRAWPRPLGMMEGIDETFDAVVFVGYHTSTTNPRGVRAHTFSSANYAAVRLNGMAMPEAGVNAAIAGHFGVPVMVVTGDDAIVEETAGIVGEVEGAIVKTSLGFHSARTPTPARGRSLIRDAVERAMARLGDFDPFVLDGPITLDLTFKSYTPAEMASYLEGVERVDAHTIRYVGADMVEISRFLQFLGGYSAGLVP